jgi:hypothetical protein
MKAYCTFCKNTVDSKQITDWSKYKKEWYSDNIDGDADGWINVQTKYHLVRLHEHKKGFLKRNRCEGSGKKKIVKI